MQPVYKVRAWQCSDFKDMGASSMSLDIRKAEKGFTLIELLVSMGILAILAGLAIASYGEYKQEAEYKKALADMHTAQVSINAGEQSVASGYTLGLTYTNTTGGTLPASLTTLMPGGVTSPDVRIGVMYNSCDGQPPLTVNYFVVTQPCNAGKYASYTKFCNGIEIPLWNVAWSSNC